jgi:hypothetical protein
MVALRNGADGGGGPPPLRLPRGILGPEKRWDYGVNGGAHV